MILDVGCGPASIADIQIDKVLFENMKNYQYRVQDAMIETWEVPDNYVEEVRMEQFLEHCPVSIRMPKYMPGFTEGSKVEIVTFYPRIHCMKEAYRVLKPKGILHVSVPSTLDTHFQDPTHEGTMITEGWFNYFCGEWGGGEKGSFANDSYGIDFKFKKLEAYMTGPVLTIRLQK